MIHTFDFQLKEKKRYELGFKKDLPRKLKSQIYCSALPKIYTNFRFCVYLSDIDHLLSTKMLYFFSKISSQPSPFKFFF